MAAPMIGRRRGGAGSVRLQSPAGLSIHGPWRSAATARPGGGDERREAGSASLSRAGRGRGRRLRADLRRPAGRGRRRLPSAAGRGLPRIADGAGRDALVGRHEALRSVFVSVEGGARVEILPPSTGFSLVEEDLAEELAQAERLEAIRRAEAQAPFDLARGPLLRGRLIRLGPEEHLFLLTQHHIVSDAWSMGVFTRELGALYRAFVAGDADPLPPLPIQYPDYAAWQREWLQGEVLERQLAREPAPHHVREREGAEPARRQPRARGEQQADRGDAEEDQPRQPAFSSGSAAACAGRGTRAAPTDSRSRGP